jgi:hypothetical protein
MTGMLLISENILNRFRKLQSFRKWDKGMDINPEDETSYTTEYQQPFLKDVENQYSAQYRHVPVNKLQSLPNSNPIFSAMTSTSCQISFNPGNMSSKDEEFLTRDNVAEMTPG